MAPKRMPPAATLACLRLMSPADEFRCIIARATAVNRVSEPLIGCH